MKFIDINDSLYKDIKNLVDRLNMDNHLFKEIFEKEIFGLNKIFMQNNLKYDYEDKINLLEYLKINYEQSKKSSNINAEIKVTVNDFL